MYCIRLDYEKEKPFLFNFEDTKSLVMEYYKEHKLYKSEYTIIKVKVLF